MNIPSDLKYTRSDEWVHVEGEIATIGITDYAQHELGELVFIELPEEGRTLAPGVSFGVVESVKAVAELNAPIAGQVTQVNAALEAEPSLINESPFEKGWAIKARIENPAALDELMSAEEYAAYRGA